MKDNIEVNDLVAFTDNKSGNYYLKVYPKHKIGVVLRTDGKWAKIYWMPLKACGIVRHGSVHVIAKANK